MAAHGLYVYGITRSGHPLPGRQSGVGGSGAPVRLLPTGRLAAVVSDAPAGLRARRRDLTAHQGLLLALAETGPVLPMRFGMVAPDEASVLRQLASEERIHLAALELLDGCLEMNLKAFPVEHSLAALIREDPQVRRLREQARRHPGYEADLRLGEAVAAGLTRRAAEAATRILDELRAVAGTWTRGPEVTGCVLNASFLVPRSETGRFHDVVNRGTAALRDRVELRITGPLPCYSFVDCDPRPQPRPVPAGA